MTDPQQPAPPSTAQTAPAPETPARRGWRKAGARRSAETVERSWRHGREVGGTDAEARRFRSRARLAALLLLFLALGAAFLFYLLFAPPRTPVLAVVAGPYPEPLPPNAWAREDVDRLFDLGGQTLSVSDVSDEWATRAGGLERLGRHIAALAERSHGGAAVVYLSMHGVVDGDGRPCLLPPDASPLDSATWLPVERVLETIEQQLTGEMKVLLVLDSGRMPANWSLGLVENPFADALAQLMQRRTGRGRSRNVVVLNSTSPGETAWASSALQASAFGYYFRLGMAGEADEERFGGDGNRRVSLHELRDYLRDRVDRWAWANRRARQRPAVLPADAADFPLAWAANTRTRRALRVAAEPPAPAVTSADTASLWSLYETATAEQPYRTAPLPWHEIERQLLWLQQAAAAGSAYHRPAKQMLTRLRRAIEEIQQDAQGSAFAGTAELLPAPVHSLPLARNLGIGGEAAAALERERERFRQAPAREGVTEFLAWLDHQEQLPAYNQTHFLRMLQRFGQPAWELPGTVPQVLRQRHRAEHLAAPAEPQIAYWTRSERATGDAACRQAEDLLFAGNPAAAQAAQQAATAFDAAARAGEVVQSALAVHDRARAELPWLAQWLNARHAANKGTDAARDDSLKDAAADWMQAVEDTRCLGQALAAREVLESGEVSPESLDLLRADTLRLRETLAGLRERLQGEYARLASLHKTDAAMLREIDDLLAIPPLQRVAEEPVQLIARQREALLRRRAELNEELHERFFSGTTDAPPLPTDPPGPPQSAPLWESHPIVALLADTVLSPEPESRRLAPRDDASKVAVSLRETELSEQPLAEREGYSGAASHQIAARIRRGLLNLPRMVGEPPGPELRTQGTQETLASFRGRLSRDERAVRAAGALGVPALPVDPVERLYRFDLQQLFRGLAERTLDDFWAALTPGAPHYFAETASNHLANAAAVFEGNPHWERQRDAVQRLAARRTAAARGGLVVRSKNVPLIDPEEDVTRLAAVVRPGSADEYESLPPGYAAVLLRWPGQSPGLHPQTVPVRQPAVNGAGGNGGGGAALEADGRAAEFLAPRDELETIVRSGGGVRAVARFRGHEFTADFPLLPVGGAEVVHTPRQGDAASVTLRSLQRRRASVVFVLDCSSSMFETMPQEGPGEIRKLTAATTALESMLDELAGSPNVHVGVVFLGHRVGISGTLRGVYHRQEEYGQRYPFPASLRPYEDVEVALELGRFGAGQAGEVADRLDLLRPWGDTPLYLAVVEAAGLFARDAADSEKRIVVITDGANNQFSPPDKFDRSAADVLAAVRDQEIRIDFVRLPAPAAGGNVREFAALARATEGSYRSVSRANEVLESFESLLEPREYVVSGPDDFKQRATVRQPVPVPNPTNGEPDEYTVRLDELEATVPVESGAAVALVESTDGRRLQSVIYEENSPRFVPLVRDLSDAPLARSGHLLGIHRPVRTTDGVRFEFSLQNEDRSVPLRPREVWVEVTPIPDEAAPVSITGGPPPSYIFYDADCEPGEPVPVWRWIARDWPAGASRAEIRFWCSREAALPADVVDWAEVAKRPLAESVDLTIDRVPGVTYQVRRRPGRLSIIERHAGDTVGTLQVELRTGRPPREIVRRFDPAHRVAYHSYHWDGEAPEDATIRFTQRTAALANSDHLDEPVIVDITNGNGLILSAPN